MILRSVLSERGDGLFSEKKRSFFGKGLDSGFVFTIYYLIAGFSLWPGLGLGAGGLYQKNPNAKEGFGCYGLISRRSGRERKNTDFARECRIATAAKCWLAAERRAENALPTKRQGGVLPLL